MDMIWEIATTIGAVLFVVIFIGFCIFFHELGHFLAARWRGLHIDAFSVGFRKIWAKKYNGVEYRIGWVPLGGYVELPQVDATDAVPKAADGTELPRAKAIDRIITAFAGPFFNILFGLALGCVIWIFGMPQDSPDLKRFEVLAVEENSPEYRAGLRPGDVIVKFDGKEFSLPWSKFVEKSIFAIGSITLTVERPDGLHDITYVPEANPNAPGRLGREKIGYPFYKVRIPLAMNPHPGSPAEKAGVKKGDLLLEVNGKRPASYGELQALINGFSEELHMTLRRGTETIQLTVRPEPLQDAVRSFKIGTVFYNDAAKISEVYPESPAEKAGVLAGDAILKVNGKTVGSASDFIAMLPGNDQPLQMELMRGKNPVSVTVIPAPVCPRTIGVDLEIRHYPSPIRQFRNILEQTWKSMRGMAVSGANSVGLTEQTSTIKPRHMSSILGMASILYNSVKNGSLIYGIYFVVMISFALAIFNLLPLPVLDGGHITFGLIEIIFRRPLPTIVIKGLTYLFIGLLMLLMLYVTYFDALRLVPERFMPSNHGENTDEPTVQKTDQKP